MKRISRGGGLNKYLGVAALAAILPVLLLGLFSREKLLLWTRAAEKPTLTLWLEPQSSVIAKGQTFEMQIIGDYSGDDQPLIPVTITLSSPSSVDLNPSRLDISGWLGQKTLGTVEVTPKQSGNFTIEVSPSILNSALPNVEIITQPAQMTVK